MKILKFVLLCLFAATAYAQEQAQVPPDVTYKTAPEAVNQEAKAALQRAFAGDKTSTKELTSDVLTCGPMLWQALKPTADKSLVASKKVMAVIGVPEPKAVEGRTFLTDSERQTFWRGLTEKYPALNGARIRKATAWEISYFWATIPFDIEEPFFAVEAGKDTFIVNFKMFSGKPVLFWIDLVGDVQNLQAADDKK